MVLKHHGFAYFPMTTGFNFSLISELQQININIFSFFLPL
jgi:hypothetical protein